MNRLDDIGIPIVQSEPDETTGRHAEAAYKSIYMSSQDLIRLGSACSLIQPASEPSRCLIGSNMRPTMNLRAPMTYSEKNSSQLAGNSSGAPHEYAATVLTTSPLHSPP